ncbi:MAG: RNA polymerase sigma factor [Acidobacteriota bacterium]
MEAATETMDTDESLVARFRSGDESAFDALVARHRRDLYGLAYRLTGCHEDADDLSQEAFMRAHRGLRKFRGEAQFRTWMTRIVVNLALNLRRVRRLRAVPLDEAVGLRGASPEGPDSVLRRQVREMIGTLPPRQRQVLNLKVYEEMSFVEIAEAAGMAVGTAKATFFQAVQGLRSRLAAAARGRDTEEVGA